MPSVLTKDMCIYAEAYALMKYRCESCGAEEVLWNSRDGVTPFLVDCRACGGTAMHVDWHLDVFAPADRDADLGPASTGPAGMMAG